MEPGIIIFIIIILVVLAGGLLWYLFGKPGIDCTKKEADTTKHVLTWKFDDKTSKCNADTCEPKYEIADDGTCKLISTGTHATRKSKPKPETVGYKSLTPKELTKSACRSVSGSAYFWKDFDDSQIDILSLEDCKSKCTLNPKCNGVDYDSGTGTCRYFTAEHLFIGNPQDTRENETCWKKIK